MVLLTIYQHHVIVCHEKSQQSAHLQAAMLSGALCSAIYIFRRYFLNFCKVEIKFKIEFSVYININHHQ